MANHFSFVAHRVASALFLAACATGFSGCRAIFGVDEPPKIESDLVADCEPSTQSKWVFRSIPTSAQVNPVRIEYLTQLQDYLLTGDDRQIYALKISELRLAALSRDPSLIRPAEILRHREGQPQAAQAVRGLLTLPDSNRTAAAALLCEWRTGCTVNLFREGGWLNVPPQGDAVPCQDVGATSDVVGALGFACFPFAAQVGTGEILFTAKTGADGMAAACVSQGAGGSELSATRVSCLTGQANGGTRISPTALAADQLNLKAIGLSAPKYMRVVSEPALDGSYPMLVVASEGYYAANFPSRNGPVFSDQLSGLPARTVSAHTFVESPSLRSILGLTFRSDSGERHVIGELPVPTGEIGAASESGYRQLAHRPYPILSVAVTRSGALYWIEDLSLSKTGPAIGLFRAKNGTSPGPETCAEPLYVASGKGTTPANIQLIVSDLAPSPSRSLCLHEEVFLVADGNLYWGAPPSDCAD